MSAAWFRMQGFGRIDMQCAGDVDVWLFCWQRSNRTMSWGDPMAGSEWSGRTHQTRYQWLSSLCRQVVVLVLDRPHRIIDVSMPRCAQVAHQSTIIDRLCLEVQRMHVQCSAVQCREWHTQATLSLGEPLPRGYRQKRCIPESHLHSWLPTMQIGFAVSPSLLHSASLDLPCAVRVLSFLLLGCVCYSAAPSPRSDGK